MPRSIVGRIRRQSCNTCDMNELPFSSRVQRFCVGAAIVVAGTAGCSAARGASPDAPGSSPNVPGGQQYPGSSAPPASPVRSATGLYKSIPKACSTLDAATLRAVAPGASAGSETDTSQGGVTEHVCDWHAETSAWSRTVTVTLELDSGGDARTTAGGDYQNELSYAPGAPQAIAGLGDKGQLNERAMKAGSSAQLHVLRQNAVITISYTGADAGGAMAASEMKTGTITAARSVISALP